MLLTKVDQMTIDYSANTDDEFRKSVIEYIKEQFSDLLGKDVALLDLPNGLDIVKEKYGIKLGEKIA